MKLIRNWEILSLTANENIALNPGDTIKLNFPESEICVFVE